jgi:Tol biopolymer transport system component
MTFWPIKVLPFLALGLVGLQSACLGDEKPSLRAKWDLPAKCDPFAPVRIQDLKEELRQTGYRLVIAIHPDLPADAKGEPPPRDLYLINADGTGLKQLTQTPEVDERVPRVSPDGKMFTYNYGDYVVEVSTLKTRELYGGYVWSPDSRETIDCGKMGITYQSVETGKKTRTTPVARKLDIVDLTPDGKWFIFELRDYQGCQYTIDFLPAAGGEIRKLPNHPIREGECHPAFSPDGKWLCWNAGGSLAIRKFDPALPEGTDDKVVTLPRERIGQDPCGRWSHCGRYLAYVKIPHAGSWRVHSPICIVRVADGASITLSPPGWLGHHWDYDWLPPEEQNRR